MSDDWIEQQLERLAGEKKASHAQFLLTFAGLYLVSLTIVVGTLIYLGWL